AAVDRQAVVPPPADDPAQRGQRELVLGGAALVHVHDVVEDVGARPGLGDPGHLRHELAGEGAAGVDLADLEATAPERLGHPAAPPSTPPSGCPPSWRLRLPSKK